MRILVCALWGALWLLSTPAFAQISGTVAYTGTESGKIFVEAFTETDATFEKLSTSLINPGPFELTTGSEGTYTVLGYIDANDNGSLDGDEIWVESGAQVVVPPGSSSVLLNLDDYVSPSDDDDAGDEDGCCATVSTDEHLPVSLVFAFGAAAFLRRRRF